MFMAATPVGAVGAHLRCCFFDSLSSSSSSYCCSSSLSSLALPPLNCCIIYFDKCDFPVPAAPLIKTFCCCSIANIAAACCCNVNVSIVIGGGLSIAVTPLLFPCCCCFAVPFAVGNNSSSAYRCTICIISSPNMDNFLGPIPFMANNSSSLMGKLLHISSNAVLVNIVYAGLFSGED